MLRYSVPPSQWLAVTCLATVLLCAVVLRFCHFGDPPAPLSVPPTIVEILGDVKRPGVLLVDGPATVGGALAAAGGCRSEAAANLPLAAAEQAITSGVRLWVECPPGGTVSVRFALIEPAALITLGVRLDINHAEPAALLLVPGMQSEFAAAIVKRRLTKPWERLDQLAEIPGVGPKTVKKWEKYLEVGAAGEKLQPPP